MAETNSGKLLSDDDLLGLDVDLALEKLDRERDKIGGFKASAKQIIGQTIKGAGQAAGDYLPFVGPDNALKRYGQEVVDANPTSVGSLADIADRPWMATKEGVGNAATSVAGVLGARAAGMGITAAAPLAGPLAPVVAALGQGVAWGGPALMAALPSYGGIREDQIKGDATNQDSFKAKATALLGAGAVGAIEVAFGPQNWALLLTTKKGQAELAKKFAFKSAPANIAKGVAGGALIEGGEELAQNPIEQLAAFQDPRTPENIEKTVFGGAMGAIGGGVVGGGMGAAAHMAKPTLTEHEDKLHKISESVIAQDRLNQKIEADAKRAQQETKNDRQKPDTAAGQKTAKAPAAEETDAASQAVLTGGIDEAALSSQPPVIDKPEPVIVNPAQTISGETGVEKQAISGVLSEKQPRIPDETPVQSAESFTELEQPANVNAQPAPGEALPGQVATIPAQPVAPQEATKAQPPAPSTTKVGDPARIMSVDSVVARTETVGGVRYDLFNGAKMGEPRAAVRVVDEDSGNVVSIKQYPNFDAAEKEYKTVVANAQKAETPAIPGVIPDTAQKSGPDSSGATITSREPWEMTRQEWAGGNKTTGQHFTPQSPAYKQAAKAHRTFVEQAIAAGKPVPAAVLADYPDLQQNLGTSQQVPTVQKSPELSSPAEQKQGSVNPKVGPVAPNLGQPVAESAPTERPAGKILGADVRKIADANLARFAKSKTVRIADLAKAELAWRQASVHSAAALNTAPAKPEQSASQPSETAEPTYVYGVDKNGRINRFSTDDSVSNQMAYRGKWKIFDTREDAQKAIAAAESPKPAAPVAEAAHVEDGKIEEVTGEVIRESVAKGADESKLTLVQQREYMLAELDKAIAKAKTMDEAELKVNKRNGRLEEKYTAASQARMPKREGREGVFGAIDFEKVKGIGYVTIDVPGDGVFRVVNIKERLQALRRQASAAFKRGPKPPTAEGPAEYTKTPKGNPAELARLQAENAKEFPAEPTPAPPVSALAEKPMTPADHLEAAAKLMREAEKAKVVEPEKPSGDTDATLARFRPKQMVVFSKPYVGKTGAKLTGYEWKWTKEEIVDNRGEDRVIRVSDWEEAITNPETNRDIVHQFQIEKTDGELVLVSAETAAKLLGVSESTARSSAKRLLENEIEAQNRAGALDRYLNGLDKREWHATPAAAINALGGALQRIWSKYRAWGDHLGKDDSYNYTQTRIDFTRGPKGYLALEAATDEPRGWKGVQLTPPEIWDKNGNDKPAQPNPEARPEPAPRQDSGGPDVESYSRGEPGPGLPAADIRAHIAGITERLAVPVTVYDDVAAARADGANLPDDTRGFAARGRLSLVAENIKTLLDAETTLFHELFHVGIRAVARQAKDANAAFANYTVALNRVAIANPEVRRRAKAWRDKYGAEKAEQFKAAGIEDQLEARVRLQSFDEAIAEITGERRGKPITRLNELIAALQRLVRALGFDRLADWAESVTDAEVLSLIRSATQAVSKDTVSFGDLVPSYAQDNSVAGRQNLADRIDAVLHDASRPIPIYLGETPAVLRRLGMESLPLGVGESIVDKALFDHGVSSRELKALADAVADPVAVVDSESKSAPDGALVVITDLVKSDGRPIIVAVHPDDLLDRTRANSVASVYPKDNAKQAVARWLATKLRYVNNEKRPEWQRFTGVQFPRKIPALGAKNIVLSEKEFVKGDFVAVWGEDPFTAPQAETPIQLGDVFQTKAGEALTVLRQLPGGRFEVRIQDKRRLRTGGYTNKQIKESGLEMIGRADLVDGAYVTPEALIRMAADEDPESFSRLDQTQTDPDTMHARAADALAKAIPQLARDRIGEIADSIVYNYVDRFHMLPRIQQRLHAGPLPESMDANLAVEAYPKVVAAQIKDFQDDYVKPFIKLLHDSNLTTKQAEEYANAKDAPDRNREMKARNPTEAELDALKAEAAAARDALAGDENVRDYIAKRRELRQAEADVEDGLADQTLVDMTKAEIAALRKEKTVKDYAAAVDKIKALQSIQPFVGDNTALSGMTDARAAEVIATAQQNGTSEALERVSAAIDAVTAKTRQILVENGLAKPEEVAAWEAAYPHYVPRFRDEVTEGTPHPVGQGMQVRGKESKRATGSTKEVTNILAHVMAAHEAAVIRAEKVKADRALFSFLAAHPDNDVAELDVDAKVRDVDAKTGLVVERVDWAYKNKANVLTLKIDGDEHTITFNEDNPEALRLAASLKNLSAQDIGEITAMVGKFTRFLATMNTSANPPFTVRNFLRDIGTAFVNLSDTELADTKKRVFADIPKAMRGFWDMTRGNMDSEWAKFAREFRDAGGQTGFLQHYKDILARAETLEKQLADMAPGKLNFTKEKAKSYWHLIEDANLAVENAVRLSAYVNARRIGMTQAKSISLASNLTVNFTKHGARGVELNMWYMFMNASIQGTARLVKALGNKNVQKILAYVMVSAFLLDMLNRGLAGDDDDDGENDYDQLPDYTKANNFVFYLGRPITIPMPYGYNFFASVGRTMSEAMFRKNFNAAKSAVNLASIFVDAFSPTGQSGSLLQFAAPTIADPFVQWAENKNFAGNPLRREQLPFGPPKPEYQMGFKSTSAPAKGLAEALNDWTGGNEVRPGLINLNPAAFDFAVTALLGGAGRTYLQMVSLPVKIAMGEEIQAREVPFLNIVASAKPEYQIERKFYETVREVETTKEELKTYRGDPDMLREIRKDHAAEIRVIGMARSTQAILENIRKQERLLEKNKPEDWRERAKRLEERKRVLMSRFNKTYTEARQ